MRSSTRLARAVIGLALVSGSLAIASSGATASGSSCSKATADQLVNQYKLNDWLLPRPAVQVLCGPFTGPGSRAMAVTIGASTCWGVQQWAVFTFAGGAWRLVTHKSVWIVGPVLAKRGDLVVTSPVRRSGDLLCNPTGGTVTRTWHWNGTRQGDA
jgi:hypothetical protein